MLLRWALTPNFAEFSTGVAPPDVSPAATAAAATAVARLQAQVRAARERAQSVAQLDAVRGLADTAALGAAYLMTHNLFAPFVAACTSDALFSAYQRLGASRLRRRQQERWKKASSVLRAKAAAAARRRKAARAAAAAADGSDKGAGEVEDAAALAVDLQDDPAFGEVTEEEVAEADAEAANADKERGKE
jgi:4-amino-4-deoxy-L-arabinose transferase-like glycosyltransferase